MSSHMLRVVGRQWRLASRSDLRRRCSLLSALLLFGTLVLSLVSAVGVQAATFNPTDAASLITAVGTAGTNTITLTGGTTYTLTTVNNMIGGANGLPVIAAGSNVTINGNGATITRSGGTAFRFFNIATGGTLTLNAVTLSNGLAAGTDGAASVDGTQGNGGAIYTTGTLTISGSTLTGNKATGGNGGPGGANGGNGGDANGGAIFNSGAFTITGGTFSNNTATAGNGGGATTVTGSGGAGSGGAIAISGIPPVSVTNVGFSSNKAIGGNGGASTGGSDGGSGGPGNGGAMNAQSTPLNVSGSSFSTNSATGGNGGSGGANNGGTGGASRGGGIADSGANTVNVTGSTFDTNSAMGGPGGSTTGALGKTSGKGGPGEGGGLYADNSATVNVTNSTFSANPANGGNGGSPGASGASAGSGGDAGGGGINIGSNGSNALTLLFVTIANNSATGGTSGGSPSGTGNGGGARTQTGTSNVRGALFASNMATGFGTAGKNCLWTGAGAPTTESYNLEFPVDLFNSCAFTNNAQTTDPKLAAALATNGGPTQTLALLAGSSAIDKGGTIANGCPATDQRGFTRPIGAACDIGAFEFGGAPSPASGLQFYPLAKPVRLLDTRSGATAFVHPNASLSAGQTLSLPGQFSYQGVTIPPAAQAIVGNATVANGSNGTPAGFATIFPSGVPLPLTSNLNFVPGTVRPNDFTVALGADTKFNLYSSSGGDFVVDISGYYAPVGAGGLYFHPLSAPVRELDTRSGATAFVHPNAALTAGQTLTLPGSFTYNSITVPASAKALVGNATVANGSNGTPAGFATLFPDDVPLPLASNLNFVPGTVAPNAFTVALGGGDGGYNLYSSTGGDFVVDITGYLDTTAAGGLLFTPLSAPVRELDTRSGATAFVHPSATLTAGQTLTLPGSFTYNSIIIPANAKALVGNATVANDGNATPAGFATLYPDGVPLPLASNLNFVPKQVAPNAITVGIGSDGKYALYSSSGGDFIIDITGYFS